MEQRLGQGSASEKQGAQTHPGTVLLEAINDSHSRREVKTDSDHALTVGVEVELSRAGIGNGTINGYTVEHQRNLARMLEKNPWRS